MEKIYDPKKVEEKLRKYWEKEKIYKFDPKSKKPIFSVDIPPPTISGRLHMGHAFGDSQQDFFVRYKRMKGFNVLNPFGTDNNGLPTLRLIEKEEGVNSKDMKREEFIELCNKTINEKFIPLFLDDEKKLGISADWDIFYSTTDKHSIKISQWSFIDIYNKGRAYRNDSPALWCPECQTTIAQVEMEDKEFESTFNDIIFKSDGKDLIIATTRPEFLPATVALFFHPDDKKYKKLKGKKAKVPLFDYEVPIMTDRNCDPEKGTGLMMVCTFGDQDDVEKYMEHKLPLRDLITKDGRLSDIAGKYSGMKIVEARKEILKDLRKNNFLVKQKPIKHVVNVHERCGTEIEFIKIPQWFIKYLDLKRDMLEWGKQIKWHPKYMRNRYDNWVKGLKWDWCISRQIAFGLPFPVWYCKDCGGVILAREKDLPVDPIYDKPPVKECSKCKSKEFIPETDVMNTWATSALTPNIVKDLLKGKDIYNKIKNKPMTIRRNGHDIITFWDFNTIVKSQLHHGINPWDELYINGWILGKDGKKMSKSKGNSVSPQEVMDKYGADPLRYLSASVKAGEDLPFPEKELVAGQKTITKLWNASRFVFMHLEDFDGNKPKKLEAMDEWMLSKVNNLIKSCTDSFEKYECSKSKADVDNFFWNVFCANYLEIVKDRVYNPDRRGKDARKSAQYVLYYSLLNILKLFAPIMPFITEEIYSLYYSKKEKEKSIHLSEWPKYDKNLKIKENVGDEFIEVLEVVRKYKSEKNKSLKESITLTLSDKKLKSVLEDLKSVTHAEVTFGKKFKMGG